MPESVTITMYYGSTTLGLPLPQNAWRVRLVRALLRFIPRANPDHEPLYPKVKRWLLEVDASGHPNREIGLDEHGKPLFAAPDSRNTGFFTDSNVTFAQSDLALCEAAEFEDLWARGHQASANWRRSRSA
jgi:hypothetical protein